jgi:hypothetical protein
LKAFAMKNEQKWVVTLAALCLGSVAVLADVPTYTIVELEMLPFSSTPAAHDVNDEGLVVGECGFGSQRVVVWSGGVAQDRGPGIGIKINSSGTVLVHRTGDEGFGHFLLDPAGGLTLVEYPDPAISTETIDLSDHGQVACTLWDATDPYSIHFHAALYSEDSFTLIEPAGVDALAGASNANGHIAGRWWTGLSGGLFLYRDGEMIAVEEARSLTVKALNDRDIMAGESYVGTVQRAVRYDFPNNIWTQLPAPSGWDAHVTGMNNSGQIVGVLASPPPYTWRAALWTADNQLHQLNDLLPPNSGWNLVEAGGINSAGMICGTGTLNGSARAFLLIPPRCPGDMVWDNQIDLLDLAAFLSAFSSCTGDAIFEPAADFDADGCVELDDLGQMVAVFGTACW